MQTKLIILSLVYTATQVLAETCPTNCIENYAPVCGSDGKTYTNKCFLEIAACKDSKIKQVSEGECASSGSQGSTNQPGCPIPGCNEYFKPVCGSDGKDYDNECFLRMAKCKKPSLTLVANTSCSKTPPPNNSTNSSSTTTPVTTLPSVTDNSTTPTTDPSSTLPANTTAAPKAASAASSYTLQTGVVALAGACAYALIKQLYEEPLLSGYNSEATASISGLSLASIITQLNSFFAVLWPVLITMALTSIVAVGVEDNETRAAMSSYLYYKDIDTSTDTTSMKTMEALTNALVIIGFIAVITFVVVILYKINCMLGLTGYLMISSSTLLGLVGSALAEKIFCEELHWRIDTYSMAFVMYNFAIVGTLSIFYQKGVSPNVGRGYLIATSVIMAWQLCQLPEWSTWAILFALAFWDLFAVLTPCGPLRCLVNLIQSEGRPMPGLLYEAEIKQSHIRKSTKQGANYQSKLSQVREYEMASLKDSPELIAFETQLHEFCIDYKSPHVHNVHAVAVQYIDRQKELWRTLYTKYNVTYVRSHRSYPHYAEVFDDEDTDLIESKTRETIKLGLGDFIFYSVLVARAAMFGFATFAACFLCVIVGLAITMYLLAHFNALPALPISILLGILCFFMMYEVAAPFINTLVFRGIC